MKQNLKSLFNLVSHFVLMTVMMFGIMAVSFALDAGPATREGIALVCIGVGALMPCVGVYFVMGRNAIGSNFFSIRCDYPNQKNTGPVAGDEASMTQLCRLIGYLWLYAKEVTMSRTLSYLYTTDPEPTVAGFNGWELVFRCNMLPPDDLNPNYLGDYQIPPTPYTAAKDITGSLLNYDRSCTQTMEEVDQPVVAAGSLIVAVTLPGVSLTNQLTNYVNYPLGGGSGYNQQKKLWIGLAKANAQDGVYQNPFSTAFAYATLGRDIQQLPVLVTATTNKK